MTFPLVPQWGLSVNPLGIEVFGSVALKMKLPLQRGNLDYAPAEGEYVVLLGVEPDKNRLQAMGIAKRAGNYIESVGQTQFKILDHIAYARVPSDLTPQLIAYEQGELSLIQLQILLQTWQPKTVEQLQLLEQGSENNNE